MSGIARPRDSDRIPDSAVCREVLMQIVRRVEPAPDDLGIGGVGDRPAGFPDLVGDDALARRRVAEDLDHRLLGGPQQPVAAGAFLAQGKMKFSM